LGAAGVDPASLAWAPPPPRELDRERAALTDRDPPAPPVVTSSADMAVARRPAPPLRPPGLVGRLAARLAARLPARLFFIVADADTDADADEAFSFSPPGAAVAPPSPQPPPPPPPGAHQEGGFLLLLVEADAVLPDLDRRGSARSAAAAAARSSSLRPGSSTGSVVSCC